MFLVRGELLAALQTLWPTWPNFKTPWRLWPIEEKPGDTEKPVDVWRRSWGLLMNTIHQLVANIHSEMFRFRLLQLCPHRGQKEVSTWVHSPSACWQVSKPWGYGSFSQRLKHLRNFQSFVSFFLSLWIFLMFGLTDDKTFIAVETFSPNLQMCWQKQAQNSTK